MKDISIIPKGLYCYKELKYDKGTGKIKVIGLCPYWSFRSDKPSQECGYCSFLEVGDWEVEDGVSLLWDQVKECGVNEDDINNGV